jgi:hypothetical protein
MYSTTRVLKGCLHQIRNRTTFLKIKKSSGITELMKIKDTNNGQLDAIAWHIYL